MNDGPQQQLLTVCRKWGADASALKGREERIAYFRAELSRLLVKRPLFEAVLQGIVAGSPYPDLRQETLFDNELILYRDPGRIFSLRLYIFGPGEHTPVHDHTSWGVSGSAFGRLEVVRYRHAGPGPEPNQVRLALAARGVLRPGDIETTMPFDEGIHRTGNPEDGTTLMVSIYGRPLRRLFIQCFDPEDGRVDRRYPPHLKKRMLTALALEKMQREKQT